MWAGRTARRTPHPREHGDVDEAEADKADDDVAHKEEGEGDDLRVACERDV